MAIDHINDIFSRVRNVSPAVVYNRHRSSRACGGARGGGVSGVCRRSDGGEPVRDAQQAAARAGGAGRAAGGAGGAAGGGLLGRRRCGPHGARLTIV